HDYLLHGDDKSLNRASELLGEIVQSSPEFTYARAEKALVDIVRHSQHPLDEKQLAALNTEIDNIVTLPELNNLSIIYQIKAVSALVKGKTDESYQAINTGIDLEMSWLNYVLLGKVYEMKGMNREAADAYLTAFNLRPGANTLYWIENGIFQTSVPYVVPYLANHFASMTGTKTTFAITLEYAASIIALVAIFKSFFGHYLGTLEGLNGLILKFGYKGDKTKVSLGKLNTISMIFIMGSTWVVAYANPNILDLIEAMGAPIIASLLCLLPMYAIRKAPSLAKYRGRLDNVFVTVIGLLTILNIVYKLF
ncbi:hypothetical protein ACUODJ_02300, partial [Escherichia sp. HC-CC]